MTNESTTSLRPIRRTLSLAPTTLFRLVVVGLLAITPVAAQDEKAASPSARWESAIQAFEQQDKEHPPTPGSIVFVGSSSIRLWDLKESFPNFDTVNRGFGGSEVADSVYFFDRLIVPHAPKLVLMYAGDNDIAKMKTPQRVHADFVEFAQKLRAAFPEAELAYIAIKPSIRRWELYDEMKEANRLIAEECAAHESLSYIDIATPMLGPDGMPRKELFAKDGLHLSKEGYALWNDLVRPHLQDAVQVNSSADSDVSNVFPEGTTSPQTGGRFAPARDTYDAFHPWTPPASREAWEATRTHLKNQVLVACGLWPMPEKTPLDAVMHSPIDRGDYTVEKVFFRSRRGHYVTGNLYRPKNIDGKIPGILCPHGHWRNGRFYDAGADAQNQLQSGAETFLSGAKYPLQARMVQLARMGATVFHYDMIGYADSTALDHRTGFNDIDAELWRQNHLGLQTWNSIRALDFLESLPEVDPQRLAVTGGSGGGTQTFLLCAVDDRPAAAFPAVMVSTGMQGGCVCENASYLRHGINNVALAALMAPKPLAMSGADDWTIEIETKGLPELRQVYSLYDATSNVAAECFAQFPHNYNRVARTFMGNWFHEHLGLGPADEPATGDFWPIPPEELSVFDDAHPRPDDSWNAEQLREAMTHESEEQLAAFFSDLPNDADARRSTLHEFLGPAAEVLFDTRIDSMPPGTFVKRSEGPIADGITMWKGVATRPYTEIQIPCIALYNPKTFTGQAVLWIDGTGKQSLFDDSGTPIAAVLELIAQGAAVYSADLYFTGELRPTTESTPAAKRRMTPAARDEVSQTYPGYTWCFNRPVLSERVRDITTVVAAIQSKAPVNTDELHLVGTGAAGLWMLLARGTLPTDLVAHTVVDLNNFAFADLENVSDPDMLPGALRYGGVGGLAALAFPGSIHIYGASDTPQSELAPLKTVFESDPSGLTVHSKALDPDSVVELLSTSSAK